MVDRFASKTIGGVMTKLVELRPIIPYKEGTDVHDIHCQTAGCFPSDLQGGAHDDQG